MDDNDSGVGSSLNSVRTSSMSGDDRSAAGSRSSATSLSEVSSPAPSVSSSHQVIFSPFHNLLNFNIKQNLYRMQYVFGVIYKHLKLQRMYDIFNLFNIIH